MTQTDTLRRREGALFFAGFVACVPIASCTASALTKASSGARAGGRPVTKRLA